MDKTNKTKLCALAVAALVALFSLGAGCTDIFPAPSASDDTAVVYVSDLIGDGRIVAEVHSGHGYIILSTYGGSKIASTVSVVQIDHGAYNNPNFYDLDALGYIQVLDSDTLLYTVGSSWVKLYREK